MVLALDELPWAILNFKRTLFQILASAKDKTGCARCSRYEGCSFQVQGTATLYYLFKLRTFFMKSNILLPALLAILLNNGIAFRSPLQQ